MKYTTPEVAWHNRDPIYSVDIQPQLQSGDNGTSWYRVATTGADSVIIIWKIEQPKSGSKPSRVDQNNVLSQLVRHEKSVNVVRFVPTGEEILASADVDGMILIWKKGEVDRFTADFESIALKDRTNSSPKSRINGAEQNGGDKDEEMNENSGPFEEGIQNVENWNQHKVLRGHLEDVVDISWSSDGLFLVSGSVDNEAIVWDVTKGTKLHLLSGHKNWVQGVGWDPLSQYVVTISADRVLRIFSEQQKRILYRVEKGSLVHEGQLVKTKLFYDYTLQSFTRRLSFSPAGEFLLVPSGVLEFEKAKPAAVPVLDTNEAPVEIDISDDAAAATEQAAAAVAPELDLNYINTCHLFLRNNLQKPFAYFPTDKFCHAVRFCPTRFCLWEGVANPFPFPYRIIFAIATQNSVIFYDTQQQTPFAFISEIHYTRISDVAWSRDGRLVMISSTDGFCTFVSFTDEELGDIYEGEPFTYEPLCVSPGKADERIDEPSTPDPTASALTNGSSSVTKGKTPKAVPEPVIKTPSVVSFFAKVTKETRMECMQKQLNELEATPKSNKRKEIAEVTLNDESNSNDNKKTRSEADSATASAATPAASTTADPSAAAADGVRPDHISEIIAAVASGRESHSSTPSKVMHGSESSCQTNGTPVRSEKKPRRIILTTLMASKDQA